MNNLTETDKAYIAGIFDGEGCIGYYNAALTYNHRPGYFHASINVCNTDPRVISWLKEVTGIGKVGLLKMNTTRRRQAYQWQLGKRAEIVEFLQTIRPYLKIKSEQVDVLLAHIDMETGYVKHHGSVTTEIVKARQDVSDKLKILKRAVFVEGVETKQAGSLIH
jgi:hypothetical protein